ncbi:MAG: hypothetical protein A2Y78_00105 [Acidobacteria bacterium RBG_13_68_16]|nr:MAG: hypothetical protein A2Y78_00105 [Acidobacteria bacterium RBG_13_68_16]
MTAVYHADLTTALDVVLQAPIATLIVDPPYSDRVHRMASSNNSQGDCRPRKRDLGFASLTPELRLALAAVAGHATRWSLVFSDLESGHVWRDALAGLDYVRSVPWVRWSQPQLTGDRPPSGAELVTIHHARGPKHWSGPGSLTAFESREPSPAGVFDARSLRGRDKYSAEKPLDLMLSQVSWFSDPDELVCDPCCGAGTTGQACRILGRPYLLLDSSAEACDIARARLEAPLSDRDRERTRRWVESQRAWLGTPPDTEGGRARYARAKADTDRAECWI